MTTATTHSEREQQRFTPFDGVGECPRSDRQGGSRPIMACDCTIHVMVRSDQGTTLVPSTASTGAFDGSTEMVPLL
jgi:hypothetical protein